MWERVYLLSYLLFFFKGTMSILEAYRNYQPVWALMLIDNFAVGVIMTWDFFEQHEK